MELYQVLLVIFVFFAESRVFLQFRDKKIGLGQFLFWTAIWASVLIVGFFAQSLGFISNFLGLGRLADVFLYASVGILFYLMYRIYMKIESVEQEITKLTRIFANKVDTFSEKKNVEKKKELKK